MHNLIPDYLQLLAGIQTFKKFRIMMYVWSTIQRLIGSQIKVNQEIR